MGLSLLRIGIAAAIFVAAANAGAQAQSTLSPTLAPQWFDANHQLKWPPNDGCAGAEVNDTLKPGERVDRYGSDYGSYFAQPGTPYDARSLPYDPTKMPYTIYVVRKPLPVAECKIAPWFGAPGGGEQFKAGESAQQLVTEGVIEPEKVTAAQ